MMSNEAMHNVVLEVKHIIIKVAVIPLRGAYVGMKGLNASYSATKACNTAMRTA